MYAFCAVSLSGTMRSAISVLLAGAASMILLVLIHWTAIGSMAKGSSAERTILARKLLVNTCVLTQMMLWCMEWCHKSVMCVDVDCGTNCCFVASFVAVTIFHKKGAQT